MPLPKKSGFTLIEVMIVVAVIGILMAYGVPALNRYMKNARVRAIASEMRDSIENARMEAIRRNNSIDIKIYGAIGNQDSNKFWQILSGDTEIRSRFSKSSEATIIVGYKDATNDEVDLTKEVSHTISFGGDGRVSAGAGKINIYPGDGKDTCSSEIACFRVDINAGGSVRMCNPNLTLQNSSQGCP